MNDITIIGAGPAGMMAAITAARRGAGIVLLEQNTDIGKKLLSTGNGKCNYTNKKMHDVDRSGIGSFLCNVHSLEWSASGN